MIIGKLLPRKLKDKIKQSMGQMDTKMLDGVISDVATRKAAAMVALSLDRRLLGICVIN